MDLSVIILAFNEGENIRELLEGVHHVVSDMLSDYEIIVVDGGSKDNTEKYANEGGAIFHLQKSPGYGGALREGFAIAKGDYIVTMDADFSHEPIYIRDLWAKRQDAELIIASRYVRGGKAEMPLLRKFLSIFLNEVYTYVLSLPYKDISSGFRLYNRNVLTGLFLKRNGFSMLQELLNSIHCNGYRILEVPFFYKPRKHGESHVRLLKMASSYLGTLFDMWRLRNSVESADYDERAYNSRILPQRYWQRKRYSIIMGMLDNKDSVLDIGCGTSRIIQSIPDAVGIDINYKSLKYLSKKRDLLVEGSIQNLPFKNESFKTVICSELIEHVPRNYFRIEEIERVLKKRCIFVLGTPDYGRRSWCFTEWVYKKIIPGGYGAQHITHYDSRMIEDMCKNKGWKVLDKKYILGMEVIFKLQKF